MSDGVRNNVGFQVEIVNYSRTGRSYWLAIDCKPLRDENGKVTGFMAIESDISERRQREYELSEARKKAEAASEIKSEFLANMSHEIRTPMTAIIGFASILAEDPAVITGPRTQRDYITGILRQGTHLLSLINDILDMSKIEAGKMRIELIPTDLLAILQDAESTMGARARDKGLELAVQFASPIPSMLSTDPVRFKQILDNLLSNAIKFTSTGTVTVNVKCEIESDTLATLVLSVKDTGIGMNAEQLSRLFSAFEQADTSTSRRYGGSGLGLNISQRLAGMLGGKITVASQLGEGTTFTVRLPIHNFDKSLLKDPTTLPVIEQVETPQLDPTQPQGRLQGIHVLLAEDGPDNQRVINFYLTRAGATLTIVENGKLAVELLTTDGTLNAPLKHDLPYDIILLDMQMPELDGYSTARLLTAKENTIPLIALTAHAMDADRDKCMEAGCVAYASKPIQPDSLISLIAGFANTAKSHSPKSPSASQRLSA